MTVPCSYYILDITQYHYKSFLTILGKTLESKKGKKKAQISIPAILNYFLKNPLVEHAFLAFLQVGVEFSFRMLF